MPKASPPPQPPEAEPEVAKAATSDEPAAAAGADDQQQPVDTEPVLLRFDTEMPALGPADPVVTVHVVGDFTSAESARVHRWPRRLAKRYGDDVRVLWVNFARQDELRATPAALAAMAAHAHGGFWKFHDAAFKAAAFKDAAFKAAAFKDAAFKAAALKRPGKLTDGRLAKLARRAGVPPDEYDFLRTSDELAGHIDRDREAATAAGAKGPGVFFVNGRMLARGAAWGALTKAVDAALASGRPLRDKGLADLDYMRAAFKANAKEAGTKVLEALVARIEAPVSAAAAMDTEVSGVSTEIWRMPVTDADPMLGKAARALVTVVEISDFECPFCSKMSAHIKALPAEFGDAVRIVFKHFPLPFHEAARPAHAAAIAAGAQGKFWEFHDKAFAGQSDLSDARLVGWARELGLDMARFERDRKAPATLARIDADLALGRALKVQGTPVTLVNGRKIDGATDRETLFKLVREELGRARKRGKAGPAAYDELMRRAKVHEVISGPAQRFDLTELPTTGAVAAPHTLVVFSEFQCPYCANAAANIRKLVRRADGKLKVVFAHFPLRSHAHAKAAAEAAQHAFVQGGEPLFAKVHDALFEVYDQLDPARIDAIARDAGVDMKALAAARKAGAYDALIARCRGMGEAAGVAGTPTMFVDGRRFDPVGPDLYAPLKSLLK